jgi:hypothetical protein
MRTIIPITCVICIATASRADDTPPAGAPVEPAAETAPEQPAAAEAAPAVPAVPVAPAAPAATMSGRVMAPVTPDPVAPRKKHSRIPEIAATAVTVGFIAATGAAYWKWDQAYERRRASQWDLTITQEEHARDIEDALRWKQRTWILIGGTFVSAAVTSFMWMRNQDPKSFSVQPTGDGAGAAASYSGRF